jgi:chitinase
MNRFFRLLFSLITVLFLLLTLSLASSSPAGAAKPPTKTPTPSGPTPTPTATLTPPSGGSVIGYFVQWGIYRRNYLVKNVDTSGSAARMTHINYAFAGISDTYECMSVDPFADYNKAFNAAEAVNGIGDVSSEPVKGNFKQLMELKQKYPHLKVLISVGGWSLSDKFSDAALPANRAAFVASCIDMYINGNYESGKVMKGVFDGIDIDWEYPGACGLTCNFRPEDTQNFTALLAEFRSQLDAQGALDGKYYSLTIAAPAGTDYSSKIELNNIPQYLDYINLMAYDFHGGWENPMVTGFHSALYGALTDPAYSQGLYADAPVQTYLNGGVPAGKLILGVPFYGRGWTQVSAGPNNDGLWQPAGRLARGKWENGVNDYKDLKPLEASYQTHIHPEAQAFYIYNGSTWWSYDNPATLTTKMNYIVNSGLGGVMFWELSGDNGDLIRAIYDVLQ